MNTVMTQKLPNAAPGVWDSKEFYRLADSRGVSGCDLYVNSLIIKHQQFFYHARHLEEIAADHLARTAAGSIAGNEFAIVMFEMEAHVEAAMHAAYSAVDILCQVVNAAVLGGQVAEDDVRLKGTIKKLEHNVSARGVHAAMTRLEECVEFAYFYAFANTSKHRRAVRSSNTITINEDGSRAIEVYMQEVRGHKGEFPGASFGVIVSEREPALRARIADVLLEINAYMAALPEKTAAAVSSPYAGNAGVQQPTT